MIVTASNGTQVDSPFTNQTALAFLSKYASTDFGRGLVKKGIDGELSVEQTKWLHILAVRAMQAQQPKNYESADLSKVVALLTEAKRTLKWPKITLKVDNVLVKISLKPDGGVRIVDANKRVFSRRYEKDLPVYYGSVENGQFKPSDVNPLPGLLGILQVLAVDPMKVIQEQGRVTGNCFLCSLPLKDERSLKVGCGRVCAERVGLLESWKAAAK